jgi:hypothetical protein
MALIMLGRQIQTVELLVHKSSSFVVEIAIEKLKRQKSPDTGQIQAELTQAGGNTLRSKINKFINFILNKEELPYQRQEFVILLFIESSMK